MAAEHGRGATVVDDEDKEIIFRQAKVEALEEKRKLLEEEEKAGQSTSKKLFRLFVLQNRRKVRLDEELATLALWTKSAQARTFVQDAPPP
jgi:hypothetical protein